MISVEERRNGFSTWSQSSDSFEADSKSAIQEDLCSFEEQKVDSIGILGGVPLDSVEEATVESHVAFEEDGRLSVVTVSDADEFLTAVYSQEFSQIHLAGTIDLSNRMNQIIDLAVDGLQIFGHGHRIYVPSCTSMGVCFILSGRNMLLEGVIIQVVKTFGRLKTNALTLTGEDIILRNVTVQNADRAAIYIYEANGVRLESVTIMGQKTAHFLNQVGLSVNASQVYVHNLAINGNATGISVVCGRDLSRGELNNSVLKVAGHLLVSGSVTQVKAQTSKGALIECSANQLVATATLSGVTTYRVNDTSERPSAQDTQINSKMASLRSIAYKQFVTEKIDEPIIEKTPTLHISKVKVKSSSVGHVKVSFTIDQPLNLSLLSRDNLVIDAVGKQTQEVLKSKNKTWSEYLYDEEGNRYGVGSRLQPGRYFTVFSQEMLQFSSPDEVMVCITASLNGIQSSALYEVESFVLEVSHTVFDESILDFVSTVVQWMKRKPTFDVRTLIRGDQVAGRVDFQRDT